MQPQHLHFPSVEILTRLLGVRGFEVVRVQEGPANVPYDFVVAAMQFLNWAAPRTDVPWRPRPTAGAGCANCCGDRNGSGKRRW